MATKIMSIINVSPDSFAADGVTSSEMISARVRAAMENHADLIDIGGQSTRPGAELIEADEELRRVIPAIEKASQLSVLPISLDTFKPQVAAVGHRRGRKFD